MAATQNGFDPSLATETISQNEIRISELQLELRSLKQGMMSLDQLEQSLALYENRYMNAKMHNDKLISDIVQHEKTLEKIESDIEALQLQGDSSSTTLRELKEQKNTLEFLLERHRQEMILLESELIDLKIFIRDFNNKITQAKLGLDNDADLEDKYLRYQQIENDIIELKRENSRLSIKLHPGNTDAYLGEGHKRATDRKSSPSS